MADFDLCLSSTGVKNIVIDKIQENFEFVVGGEGYTCPRIISEVLSPRASLSHSVDSSIAEYVVETPDPNNEFQLFLSLGSGSTIRATQANLEVLLSLSREFRNSNLYISLLEHFDIHFICSQLGDSLSLDLFSEGLIGCISSNFYRLTQSEFEEIPVSVLFHILSHNLLKISSEDDLFSFISSRICSDPEYFDLLPFVRFEYLSPACVSGFLSAVQDSIDRHLWLLISRRLILHVGNPVDFPLKAAKSLDGIIAYLTGKHGGNVHDKGIVTFSSKSIGSDYSLGNLTDLRSDTGFCTKNEPGQWFCCDFHEMRVRPTHYTIRIVQIKSWVVEGSLDGETWTEMDRKTDSKDFVFALPTVSFAISNSAECRFIRLTQTDKRCDGKDWLYILAFEVFGTLIE
jgi:hypothetical protein